MAPLVSVVIPSYNHKRFVGQAVESVRAQTHPAVEIVVVDDGSSDGSFEFLRETVGDALAVLRRHDNRGAHATINDAIASATGDWIAILNSDDLYAPQRIERLVDFATGAGHDLVFSDVAFCDETGPLPSTHKVVQSHDRAVAAAAGGTIEQALLRGNFVLTTSNLLFRRDVFAAVGPFRPYRYCHDWDFLLRAIGAFRLGWLREPLLQYRLHGSNTIREPDHWRHLVEKALVYAGFLGGDTTRPAPAVEHSGWIFEARELSPVVVCWLAAECRRLGLAAVLQELEAGTLHRRVQAAFADEAPARITASVREMKKGGAMREIGRLLSGRDRNIRA
ncbi:hypothetical protein CCR97_24735 [Rhodoplanes elegans]|nr:glycosyltransferase [Rhodoplanes elegans]MBK5961387.1 hypothetical protein [Rhodoplanes elegans]